jgi:hypothetical protein
VDREGPGIGGIEVVSNNTPSQFNSHDPDAEFPLDPGGKELEVASMRQRHIAAGITMLTHLKYEIKLFARFVLPQKNWLFHSGKTNAVMLEDFMRRQRFIWYGVSRRRYSIWRMVPSGTQIDGSKGT